LPELVGQNMLDAAPSLSRTAVRPSLGAARWRDGWRFDRRDLGLVVTLAAAAAVINTSGSFRLLGERSLLEVAEFAGTIFVDHAVVCFGIVAALKVMERLPITGWRRHLTTMATGIALTVAVGGFQYFVLWLYVPSGLKYGVTSSALALLLYAAWLNAALALLARAWMVKSRDEASAGRLLARMRSEQMSVRRRLVEGRLKAIQARVDPLFFFAMLEAVQKTYGVNAARAEQLLDELTAFLRAALPRLRAVSSTVDQECELATSFARLRMLAGVGTSRLDFDIAPAVVTANFPPGVLLPLVGELLHATASTDSVRISFSTDAAGHSTDRSAVPNAGGARGDGRQQTVVMQVTARTNPWAVPAQARSQPDVLGATADVQATLFDLFGTNADLTSTAIDGGVQTTVRIPYEPASA
jgi:hypothetical protein